MIKEFTKQVVPNAISHHPLADAHPSPWPTPPGFVQRSPFLVCSEHKQGNFISQALKVFMWKPIKPF